MSSHLRATAFALLAVITPWAVFAADRIAHPADPDAAVPATTYQSAFAGYHKAGFSEKRDWRAANDAVRDAGGHAGAMQGEDLPPASPHAGQGMSMPMPMPVQKPMPGSMPMMPGHHHGYHATPEKQP
jgi:hypothetical protein